MPISNAPARYYPFRSGQFSVTAGLYSLGQDFGNAEQDAKAFQLDREWQNFHSAKLAARSEHIEKYVCQAQFDGPLRRESILWLAHRLAADNPDFFSLTKSTTNTLTLRCVLSGEVISLSKDGDLLAVEHDSQATSQYPRYTDAWDALACQAQEDIAVVHVPTNAPDRLAALHLCFPNHWSPQIKIGKSFLAVHQPVADFDRIAGAAPHLLANAISKGPFVRFAWGLATDARLNHHPDPPKDDPDPTRWNGRAFDPKKPELYVRVERQTLNGLPQANGFVFTIRTYFLDVKQLSPEDRRSLNDAVISMSDSVKRYKGLNETAHAICDWLTLSSPA